MNQLSFQPVLGSYLLVFAMAAALLLLLLVRPARTIAPAHQRTLRLLRLAVVLLVLLAMLRPTWIGTVKQPLTATLLVLLDLSRSMQLPDASGSNSRWQSQRDALLNAAPVLEQLPEGLELKVYGYDQQLHALDFEQGRVALPDEPTGEQTDIGSTLLEAARRELGKRLAGVVLLGDGTQTAVDPEVEVQEAGREIARLGSPLYTIAFGPSGDALQSRDVAVENLPQQFTVFVKNELVIEAVLRARGYANRQIPVELVVEQRGGEPEVLGPLMISPGEDGQAVPIEISYVPQIPGSYKLTLRAAEQPGEVVTGNNQLSAFLTVLEGGLRVLYLAGELRFETRFLRTAISNSPDIELDVLDIDQQNRASWPVDLGTWLEDPKYDAFLIGDVDSEALGTQNLQKLQDRVAQGKGLMMLGGFHSFGPGGYRSTPLADVLPIVMERFERQDFSAPLRTDLHLEAPVRMLPTRDHPIVQLATPDQNEAIWRQLSEMDGANKFADVKDGAGVQVIAATPAGDPLLVTGEYGSGRVLAFAADSTWRWAMHGHDDQHRRFWRQAILWLVKRDDLNRSDVWIDLRQRRVDPNTRLPFTVGARRATGEAVPGAQFQVELLAPDGTRSAQTLTAGVDDMRGTLDDLTQPGDYALIATASEAGETLGTARVDFQVVQRDLELASPAADPDQLARLAAQTRDHDGRAITPEQLPDVLRQIQQRLPESEIDVQTKWQLADTTLDAWLFFLLLTALLSAEWALRKKWGLV